MTDDPFQSNAKMLSSDSYAEVIENLKWNLDRRATKIAFEGILGHKLDDDGTIDNSTERYVDLIHRFNKDKAFDYVIGIKDKDDKIIDRGFDD